MDANALEDTLRKLGYAKLNPMQDAAVKAGLLDAGNFVASAPTASGKTLLALLKMAANKERGKSVYIAPLRALAAEKHREFTQALAAFEMSVALTTGDLDSSDEQLAAFDVIVATSEKLDSLLRHKTSWL
ncbi:MAG: DEAD/DEAH box helicase, partial [Candidatus Micrarchaeota archaeon]